MELNCLQLPPAMLQSEKRPKRELIVKGSNHIEEMAKLKTVILDKTGTITEGAPLVQQVISCEGYNHEEVIRLAAIAEKNSSHPIADAIVRQAKEWNITIPYEMKMQK